MGIKNTGLNMIYKDDFTKFNEYTVAFVIQN